jgi:hypothetical protein
MRSGAEAPSKGGKGESTYVPNRKGPNCQLSPFLSYSSVIANRYLGRTYVLVQDSEGLEQRTGIQEIRGMP